MGWNQKEDFASNAKANTGVALGATSLGVAVANALTGCNGNGGGLLGRIVGGGCNNNDQAVIAATQAALAHEQAENAKLRAEKYTDHAARDTYDRSLRDAAALVAAEAKTTAAYLAPLSKGVANLEVKEAAQAVEIAAMKKELELKDELVALRTDKMICEKLRPLELAIKGNADSITQLQVATNSAIEMEAFKRKCADEKIVSYVNSTFAQKLIANMAAGTGTTTAQTYNPLGCSLPCQQVEQAA